MSRSITNLFTKSNRFQADVIFPVVTYCYTFFKGATILTCSDRIIDGRYILSAAHCVTDNNPVGLKRSPILGGDMALPHEFPYAVTIFSGKTACTGGIIGERYVLSAAHCFADKENQFKNFSFDVIAGIDNFKLASNNSEAVVIAVKRIFIPSSFQYNIRKADIAIVKLTKKLNIGKNHLQKLKLPVDFGSVKACERGVVAGFGVCEITVTLNGTRKIVENYIIDGKLRSANVEVVNKFECHAVPYGNFQVGEYHFLAKMIKNSTKIFGLCYGDSGSLFVHKSKIVLGVMVDAFDKGCDGRILPSIFINVQSYMTFINNVLNRVITKDIRVRNLVNDKASRCNVV